MVDVVRHRLANRLASRGRWLLALIVVVLLGSVGLYVEEAGAVPHPPPVRIGVLTASWGPTPTIVGLRNGLLKLGYREDEDFVLGIRFTQGDLTALPTAAHELVQYGVDMIIADTDMSALAAQRATSKIPIVFAGVGDPVGMGLVRSFAEPGGNVTGMTELSSELAPKRLEIFRELVPNLHTRDLLVPCYPGAGVEEGPWMSP